MGGLKHFEIKLEGNPAKVYFAGDLVKGRIFFGLDSDGKKARGVRVEMKGKAEVAFTKKKGFGKNRRTRYYSDEETYFKELTYVIGDGTNETQIAAGEYEFPFQFQLPENIPSSFVGEHGRVAYSVTGVIDRPWKFDHETVAFFSVVHDYDLNLHKDLAEAPQSVSEEKYMCCCWCRSGPVSASGQTSRTGYVSGETIHVQVMADNKSNVLIKPVRMSLVQTQTFKADKLLIGVEEKEFKNVLKTHESVDPLEPGESDSYDVAFEIPALPPSELELCTKIDIGYSILIEVPPKGCHINLEVAVPIIIGTIPIGSTFSNLKERKFQGDKTLLPREGGVLEMRTLLSKPKEENDDQNLYPDLPPPSYQEAKDMPAGDQSKATMRMDTDNEHATGNWDFKPIYPYYGQGEAS